VGATMEVSIDDDDDDGHHHHHHHVLEVGLEI
jgi:hypothetical protein